MSEFHWWWGDTVAVTVLVVGVGLLWVARRLGVRQPGKRKTLGVRQGAERLTCVRWAL